MFQYFTFGVGEYYRGIVKSAQVKQLQRYVPSLKVEDVERWGTLWRVSIKMSSAPDDETKFFETTLKHKAE